MNNKNILVTGACGFIASHIIEELLKDSSSTIIGIDNFYSGNVTNLNLIRSLDIHNRFTFIEMDIRDFDELQKTMKDHHIKYIYHLAAIVSVQESIDNPVLSHSVNVQGTLNVLESARLNNIEKIVFSSSAAVYGDELSQPKNEDSPLKPISPYGLEKLIGEQYMHLYTSLYQLQTVILRYFNVYGERQSSSSDYSGVISIFDNKFSNNEVPNIYGNGEQYRDFIYVKDVAKINIKAMNSNQNTQEIFCVGTAKKTSINDLYKVMQIKYNITTKAEYKKARDGDILESLCDNSKLKKFLGFRNFVAFEV